MHELLGAAAFVFLVVVGPIVIPILLCAAWCLLKDIVEIILTDPADRRTVPPAR